MSGSCWMPVTCVLKLSTVDSTFSVQKRVGFTSLCRSCSDCTRQEIGADNIFKRGKNLESCGLIGCHLVTILPNHENLDRADSVVSLCCGTGTGTGTVKSAFPLCNVANCLAIRKVPAIPKSPSLWLYTRPSRSITDMVPVY